MSLRYLELSFWKASQLMDAECVNTWFAATKKLEIMTPRHCIIANKETNVDGPMKQLEIRKLVGEKDKEQFDMRKWENYGKPEAV